MLIGTEHTSAFMNFKGGFVLSANYQNQNGDWT